MSTKIKISSSVLNFRDKVLNNWPVEEYQYPQDINKPVCFFGLYHSGDYQAFLNHKGKKMIFWCGSDILNLECIKLPLFVAETNRIELNSIRPGNIIHRNDDKIEKITDIFSKHKNVCENKVEQKKLSDYGIVAEIHPTFAGNIDNYTGSKKEGKHVWLCLHEGREKEYGLSAIRKTASAGRHIYHIYGIKKRNEKNIIYHGKVSEEQLDEEIKEYQVALRSNKFEGFSEVVAKGILLEQIVWSYILYPKMENRKYWVNKLSDFNWLKM